MGNKSKAASKRVVKVTTMIGGKDDQTGMLLQTLEQVGDFDIGMPVLRILALAALAEQRLRLI